MTINEFIGRPRSDDSPSRLAGDTAVPRMGVVSCDEPRSVSDQSIIESNPPFRVPSLSPPLELPSPSPYP